jgi:uncharacterized membrane protein (UPF0127 family)
MRNTLIPLDMVFIRASGEVLNIAENTTPLSLAGVPAAGPVRYVLELNDGGANRARTRRSGRSGACRGQDRGDRGLLPAR